MAVKIIHIPQLSDINPRKWLSLYFLELVPLYLLLLFFLLNLLFHLSSHALSYHLIASYLSPSIVSHSQRSFVLVRYCW